ncbi:MAG: hypothetical protein JOZ81_14520 [Chloroflexi bacterium]|nr:hypothetical protein [Chloroflexota bacterium]
MKISVRRLVVAGGAVVVLGVAAVGVSAVQAQTAPATSTSQAQAGRQKFLTALANRLHISVDQLQQAITGARQDAGLPAPGQRPNGTAPNGPRGAGGFGGFFGKEADAVAALFHEDRTALMNEVSGKTLAEVAAAHNVQTSDLINTIVTTANQQIDQMAQQRNISADRVAQMKQQVSGRVQAFVTTHRFPARATGSRS